MATFTLKGTHFPQLSKQSRGGTVRQIDILIVWDEQTVN